MSWLYALGLLLGLSGTGVLIAVLLEFEVGSENAGGVELDTLTLGKEPSGVGVNAPRAARSRSPRVRTRKHADERLAAAAERPEASWMSQTRARQPERGTWVIEAAQVGKPGPAFSLSTLAVEGCREDGHTGWAGAPSGPPTRMVRDEGGVVPLGSLGRPE